MGLFFGLPSKAGIPARLKEAVADLSKEHIAAGKLPLFQSYMYDGSPISLEENVDISTELLKEKSLKPSPTASSK